MINKNVLFPVDTEAYHVMFSSEVRQASSQRLSKLKKMLSQLYIE